MRQKSVSRWKSFENIPGTLVPPKRARKAPKEGFDKESTLQSLCEQYLDRLGLFYIRLPDSLWRNFMGGHAPIYAKKQASDCLSGLPDLTVLDGGRYIAFELKSKTGKMSAKQRDVQKAIGTHEVKTFEYFKSLIEHFIGSTHD